MKRIHGVMISGCCSAFILLAGCGGKSSNVSGVWIEETSTYSIAEENVSYTLPTDISVWAIAGPESLPPSMEFFGIDTAEEVCVGIFHPAAPLSGTGSTNGYSRGEVENTVMEISSPRPGQKVVDEKYDSYRLADSSGRSWYFSLSRKLVDPSMPTDTFAINYSGYLFDGKTHPLGLVVISSLIPTDSIGRMIFDKYVSGLKIEK